MNVQKQEFPNSVRRYKEIDIVKGIGIICIVAGHVFPATIFNQFLFFFSCAALFSDIRIYISVLRQSECIL